MNNLMAPYCQPPIKNIKKTIISLPSNSCDTHVHIFDSGKYQYQSERAYTPHDCTSNDLIQMHNRIGISRSVLVQASVHGTNNQAVLDRCKIDPINNRCVISINKDVKETDIEYFHIIGARGIRINLVDTGGMPFDSIEEVYEISKMISNFGWHIEFLLHIDDDNIKLTNILKNINVPIVVGHFGYMNTSKGIAEKKFLEFISLLKDGHCWVKLTGPYRISNEPSLPYSDVLPFAEKIIDAAPNRTLWGSDWPHVMLKYIMPDDSELANLISNWIPSKELQELILVKNPEILYGFSS